jgi:hypothetical protein
MIEHQTFWTAQRAAAAAAFCLVASLVASPARAETIDAWTAVEIGGQVSQRSDGSWQPVARGSTLADGAWLRIGADGKLVLSHRKDTITASPGSEFQLPHDAGPASGFSILQTLGTLLFRIEHTPGRRFEVDAPYLAAVVKGTVFTVSAGDTGNSVHVAEGAVEVTTRVAHEVALIRPGQTAAVASSGGALSITGGLNPAQVPLRRSETKDPKVDAKGPTADAVDKLGEPQHGRREITRTLGDEHLDIAVLTKGLLDGGGQGPARRLLAHAGAAEQTADGVADAPAGNSNAAGGNSNVASSNPNAAGSSSNAAGGNPNAAGGNPNAAGGNPNAAGGNSNAADGNPNAHGGNPNAAGGNPNAHGGNPNAAGGNASAKADANKTKGHGKP